MQADVSHACRGCLNKLLKQTNEAQDFLEPVPATVPGYYKEIKRPTDLGTVGRKLHEGLFSTAHAFFQETRRVFTNAKPVHP